MEDNESTTSSTAPTIGSDRLSSDSSSHNRYHPYHSANSSQRLGNAQARPGATATSAGHQRPTGNLGVPVPALPSLPARAAVHGIARPAAKAMAPPGFAAEVQVDNDIKRRVMENWTKNVDNSVLAQVEQELKALKANSKHWLRFVLKFPHTALALCTVFELYRQNNST